MEDGATVPIYYESRSVKLDLNHEELETLSNQVDELVEDEETDQKEKTKSDWSRLENWLVLNLVSPRWLPIWFSILRHVTPQ